MATTRPESENGIDSVECVESFDLPGNWAAHGGREDGHGIDYYAVRVRFAPTSIRSGPIRHGSAFYYAGELAVEYVQPRTRDVVVRTYEAVQHQDSSTVLPSCLWGGGVETFPVVIQPQPAAQGGGEAADRLLALANRLYDVETALSTTEQTRLAECTVCGVVGLPERIVAHNCDDTTEPPHKAD
ncbi:hypothetical protein GCM10009037_30620 [Halarchaeum grantii]|uniref:Uncharacterized protein n=1 Tax=Halarchaeum grantii TaxID=1193105 RepID=A0A830FEB6_9EURY|nr:hypothetical protein [Halarchaeum grantii]GGL45102.1 hypothetical protein GCM10009037_30620 [Halarchaeum grantii]